MKGKITLITPPDFFENNNLSILFVNLSDKDQDIISQTLAQSDISNDVNFYVFNQETNVSWLLYAFHRCNYRFINFDNGSKITNSLGSYLLANSNTFFHTSDENLTAIYSHINQNKITNVKTFLERIFHGQN